MIRIILGAIILASFTAIPVFSQTNEDAPIMFEEARATLLNGQYADAVRIYDEILELYPNNISTLKMKGIVESNLDRHESSLKQFFKILQHDPDDIIALTGMGVGFGNFAEYHEAKKYFELALERDPDSIVINNYNEYIDKVLEKYPYQPTEKPDALLYVQPTNVPEWVKPIAKWWSEGVIHDSEFVDSLNYMIEKKIIKVPTSRYTTTTTEPIPEWVRQTAGWWADGQINNIDFVLGIQYLIENGIVIVDIDKSSNQVFEENKKEFSAFETYIRKISNTVGKEKRYIEYPNPSGDVIKKFLRDYVKWNFEQEVKNASSNFPDPTFEIIDDVVVVQYKVYINEQPPSLPLDHVSTLENSFEFWENQKLETDGTPARIDFVTTTKKHEANVWVTWVVRDIGEGVLGHAHLGKGVVEVTLGDYGCDGSFQLYDVASVEYIMTHELGHSIGLQHVTEPNNIMYPSANPNYAYCLLS